MRLCGVVGCGRPHRAQDLCDLHYDRLRTRGTTEDPPSKRPAAERFWAAVVKGDGCWGWTGSFTAKGYACLFIDRKRVLASRFSYELHVGPIPAGACVLHRCDDPACTNPACLFLGSKGDNNADRDGKGRQAKGERVAQARLTEDAVRSIRARYAAGESNEEIAVSLGYKRATNVQSITSGRTWRHLL